MSKKKSAATRKAEQRAAAERAAAVRREQEAKERRRRTLTITGVVAAVLTAVLLIGYAVQSSRDTTGQAGAVPQGVVGEGGYAVPRGESSAPVTVTVYEDFMCPFCGDLEEALAPMLEERVEAGDVQVHYRVLSFLDRASDGSDYSTRSMNALGAVLDTAGPEAAVRFHDLLFAEQPEEGTSGPSDDELVALAVEAGADEADVRAPIENRKFEQWVVNATDAASKEDVASTPTVLVDGEVVEFETIDELVAGIEAAVEEGLAG